MLTTNIIASKFNIMLTTNIIASKFNIMLTTNAVASQWTLDNEQGERAIGL